MSKISGKKVSKKMSSVNRYGRSERKHEEGKTAA